jgi:hypothetical protein
MCSAVLSFTCVADNIVTIRFFKKDAFPFQPPAQSNRRIEEQKVWKFKTF